MKKIAVLTATRADYGLLSPVIRKLMNYQDLDVRVAVSGAHLSPEFGMTVTEIQADGIPIDREIEILRHIDTVVLHKILVGIKFDSGQITV